MAGGAGFSATSSPSSSSKQSRWSAQPPTSSNPTLPCPATRPQAGPGPAPAPTPDPNHETAVDPAPDPDPHQYPMVNKNTRKTNDARHAAAAAAGYRHYAVDASTSTGRLEGQTLTCHRPQRARSEDVDEPPAAAGELRSPGAGEPPTAAGALRKVVFNPVDAVGKRWLMEHQSTQTLVNPMLMGQAVCWQPITCSCYGLL